MTFPRISRLFSFGALLQVFCYCQFSSGFELRDWRTGGPSTAPSVDQRRQPFFPRRYARIRSGVRRALIVPSRRELVRTYTPPQAQQNHHPSARSFGSALGSFSRLRGITAHTPPANCSNASAVLVSMRESHGFFCDDDPAWQVKKRIAQRQQPFQRRSSPWGTSAFFQENWEPDFSCSFEQRLGRSGDGGKWVCDPLKLRSQKDCLIYSFGSENKFDFEDAVSQNSPNCEIHTFDHTVGMSPSNKPAHVHFHPWGLGNPSAAQFRTVSQRKPLKTLSQIVAELGHWNRQISILKIDVEGAEFDALPPLLKNGTFDHMGIQQVLLEIHKAPPEKMHDLLAAFRNANYAIFHKEPNIQFPLSPGNVCAEYAFVRLTASFWQ